jgi:hypothetical protein
MHYAQALGTIHAVILGWLTWRSSGRLIADRLERACATFLLVWCNLVYVGLILSLVSKLNVVALYFTVSIGLAAALEGFLRLRGIAPLQEDVTAPAPETHWLDRTIRYVLASALALAALASLLICVHYVPNNWDTITYRFGRVFFYLGHGNLLHAGNPGDPRLSFYPFNGTLSYIFLAIYQAPARWFNLVSGMAWVFAGIATYRTAKRLGASRTGCLVAVAACLLSPAVLAQAASGNDELLAATPILMGILFGWTWAQAGHKRHAILAGVGAGLGIGTKLHWTFYAGFCLLGLLVFALLLFRRPELRSLAIRRIPAAILAGAIALPLVAAFLVCNYMSTGKLTDSAFNDQVLNTPFRFSIAREKLIIAPAELLISPIPDLIFPIHLDEKSRLNAAVNAAFMKRFSRFVPLSMQVSPSGTFFRGPMDYHVPAETTVWLGLLPHFLILMFLVHAITRKLPTVAFVFVAAFLCWVITYAAETRYVWWSCSYYCFPAVLVAAALGSVWDRARRWKSFAGRVLLVAFLGLFASHMVLSASLLSFGMLRNVQFLWHKGPAALEVHAVDRSVIEAIQNARKVYIPSTHWEVLYFNFMRFNPAARFSTGSEPRLPSPDTLMLLSAPPDISDGWLPLSVPAGGPAALTYIGEANSEHYDHVFAQGNGIESRYPERSHYTFVQIAWERNAPGGKISGVKAIQCCVGLTPSDGVAIRYRLRFKSLGESDSIRMLPGEIRFDSPANQGGAAALLMLESYRIAYPDRVAGTEYALDQPSYGIPDSGRSSTGSPQDLVSVAIPSLGREPYELAGKHYTVAWLGKETPFTVTNLGKTTRATLAFRLATAGKPHTAILRSDAASPQWPVTRVFWANGADTVRWDVTLQPGENRFVLGSAEAADLLPDGRAVCFLLIGDAEVSPGDANGRGR